MAVSYASFDPIAFFQGYTRLRPNSRVGKQWVGACPFHDCSADDDGFIVFPELTERGCHYHCRVCGRAGDALAFVREYEGLSFRKGCQMLGLTYDAECQDTSPLSLRIAPGDPPSGKWQEQAGGFAQEAIACLWSDGGKPARAYLYTRGLTDEYIRRAKLGYNPRTRIEAASAWGIVERSMDKIWLPRGIVIPWIAEYDLWKLNIRRGEKDLRRDIEQAMKQGMKPHKRKYVEVRGSAEYLYNAGSLVPGRPVVLVEGEFDVVAALQSGLRDLAAVVATGSTQRGRTPRSIGTLALASQVLVAFDADENGRGDEAAGWWLNTLQHAIRWKPWARDVNDMLQRGHDIRLWAELGIEVAAKRDAVEMPGEQVVSVDPLPSRVPSFTERGGNALSASTGHQVDAADEVVCTNLPLASVSTVRPVKKAYWSNCSTKVFLPGFPEHCGVPEWLIPGTRAFKQLVRRIGYAEAMLRWATFLHGWDDVRGNHWCGQCYWHMRLVDAGNRLGYSDLHDFYCDPETRLVVGYEAWLHFAAYAGSVLVQSAAQAVEAELAHPLRTDTALFFSPEQGKGREEGR